MQLPTVGLLLIRDRKLLLAYSRNKKCFYLPGGKVNEGETTVLALCREIEEELQIRLSEEDLRYYTHITAPAFGEEKGMIMEQDCFLTNQQVTPTAAAEIGELRYFNLAEYLQEESKAPGAIMVLQQLKKDGLIE